MTDRESAQYIIDRTGVEKGASDYVDSLLAAAAAEIARISARFKITPNLFRFSANRRLNKEVEEVLDRLRTDIYAGIENYSVSFDKDRKDWIVSFINDKIAGKTLKERIKTYVVRFKYEVEAMVAAGLLFGMKAADIAQAISDNLHNPWNNSLFKKGVKAGEASAIRLRTGGVSYGAGHSNSAANLLDTLTRYTVGSVSMELLGMAMEKKGAKFFISHRGSSYNCGECDLNAGIRQPIENYTGGWHINCKCWFEFLDDTEQRI